MGRDGVSASPRGIVPFSADKRSWRLVASVNALCLIEAEVKDPDEVVKLMTGRDASFSTVRTAFWAALQDHHPDLTPDDAGRLIDHLGLTKAGSLMAQTLIAAFPAVGEDGVRPRMAASRQSLNGTGGDSSANGSSWISRLTSFGFRRRAA